MNSITIGKEEWISMLQEVGLDEAKMERWHHIFEHRHADAHQAFLEWLNLTAQEIKLIRAHSAKS
ncbi:MAG: hypothetical protein HQL77_17400 [Magnetococcales bacterium]|nr:hypothetical protein [Magnetococcales bacterium]